MEREIELLDAREHARGSEAAVAIDFFPVGNDARDGAKSAGDAHRLRIGVIG